MSGSSSRAAGDFALQFPKAWNVIERAIAESKIPGAVAGVSLGDKVWVSALGKRRLEIATQPSQPMSPTTVFDLASLTKILATAPLFARLVERGWLSYETPVAKLLDGYRWPEITLAHLLSHTSGLPAWVGLFREVQSREDLIERVKSIAPEGAPGKSVLYSDIGFILLGAVAESVLQRRFRIAVRDWVWKPMNLGFQFSISRHFDPKAAATEDCPWRKRVLQGEVHDENCFVMGGDAGHAGVFGDIYDVIDFGQGLLQMRFLGPPALQVMWKEHLGSLRTMGWDKPARTGSSLGEATNYFSKETVGHLGFTGTSLWIDPVRSTCVALLTNRVHPTRTNDAIKEIRPAFHTALVEDIVAFSSNAKKYQPN